MSVALRCGLKRACRMPARTALAKCSGGRCGAGLGAGRHHSRPAMTPTLLKASSQKGTAMPNVSMIAPPAAGPTARLTLIPTLLSATAAGRAAVGTNWLTTACHAGAVAADPTLTRSVMAKIFVFNDRATTKIYTLSLHDALPI